jgi:diadenosine tetraphosphate (Ap4A) HIT family hydrolase
MLFDDSTYVRRVPLETDNFALIPSLGPVVPGHVLLCPKEHLRSLSQMSEALAAEFYAFRERVFRVLSMNFAGSIHCFEHGTSHSGGKIVCTVAHAHLHILPTDVQGIDIGGPKERWHMVEDNIGDLSSRVGKGEYLFYRSPKGQCQVALNERGEFASQHLRKVFADAVGSPEKWNWRDRFDLPSVDKTFRLLRENSLS